MISYSISLFFLDCDIIPSVNGTLYAVRCFCCFLFFFIFQCLLMVVGVLGLVLDHVQRPAAQEQKPEQEPAQTLVRQMEAFPVRDLIGITRSVQNSFAQVKNLPFLTLPIFIVKDNLNFDFVIWAFFCKNYLCLLCFYSNRGQSTLFAISFITFHQIFYHFYNRND